MGNLSTILTAILCASAPLASIEVKDPRTEQSQSKYILGKETISSVRASYENGDYDAHLQDLDESYVFAKSENELEGLVQMRQKAIPFDFQDKWESEFLSLQNAKNEDLLNVVSNADDSVFVQKVRSVIENPSSPEQERAVSYINNLVLLAPTQGKNADENTLIDIDLEYEYKLLHAVMPRDDISPQERQELQIALRMEKMDRMLEASKSFQDSDLKKTVGLAASNLDARLSRNLDGADLNSFVKGSQKPSNETEQRVVSILTSYQAQFSDLMKNIADANR